jgi:O-antigen ligase
MSKQSQSFINSREKYKLSFYSFISDFLLLLFLVSLVGFVNVRPFFIIIQWIFIGFFLFRFIWEKNLLSGYTLWSVLVVLFAFGSIFTATKQSYTFSQSISFMQPLIFCNLIIPYMLESQRNYHFVLQSIIMSALVLLIRLLINTPLYLWGTTRVGETIGYNPNTIGLVLSLSSILSFYLFNQSRNKLYFFMMILLGFASLFSGSRKAFAILIVGVFLLSIISASNKKQFFISIVIGVLLLSLLLYLTLKWEPLYLVIGKRVESLVQGLIGGTTDSSTSTRFDMISTGLQYFIQKPFFGYGLGNYRFISGFNTYSHNNYTELLVSFGLFGTGLYYSMHLYILGKGMNLLVRKGFKQNPAVLSCIVIGIIMLMDFGLVSYYDEFMQLILAVSFVSLQRARIQ